METSINNNHKLAVITGSSSGVGLATAELFGKAGFRIVIAARGENGLKEAQKYLESKHIESTSVICDMSEYEEVQRLVEKALEITGSIDVWVNNAGVMASGKFEEIPIDVTQQVIKNNLFGYMNAAHAILPIFKKQEHGILINNVSIAGYMPAPLSTAYTASKFGIRGLSEGLMGETANYPNIHICNIYPQMQNSTGNLHSAKYSGVEISIPPTAADPKSTAQLMLDLAFTPKKHSFPDTSSYLLTKAYSFAPTLISTLSNSGLKLMSKIKDAPTDEGNILEPSEEPHRIYGNNTIKTFQKNKTSILLSLGIGVLSGFILLNNLKK